MKKYVVLVAVLLVALGAQLYSQPGDMKALHKIIGKLNLTDEQKKDVQKVHFDAAKQTVAQKAKLETARIELQQLLKADNPDKSAIEKKISEMADIGVQLRMVKLNSWFAINKMLTPDQQKTWKKVLENAPAMRRQWIKKRIGERPMLQQRHHEQMSN